MDRLKVAVLGIRSLPPTNGSGGAETYVEEVFSRLTDKGVIVIAYIPKYQGIKKKEANFTEISNLSLFQHLKFRVLTLYFTQLLHHFISLFLTQLALFIFKMVETDLFYHCCDFSIKDVLSQLMVLTGKEKNGTD